MFGFFKRQTSEGLMRSEGSKVWKGENVQEITPLETGRGLLTERGRFQVSTPDWLTKYDR